MVIRRSIPIEAVRPGQDALSELARQLMPLFSMEEDEYRVRDKVIDGVPDALRFDRRVTAFRVAVYDVKAISHAERKELTLIFRLYKGVAIAILIWFISGFLLGSIWRWESLILPALGLGMFNGLAVLTILKARREAIAIIQRWGRNQIG